jgi:hypothetical protein
VRSGAPYRNTGQYFQVITLGKSWQILSAPVTGDGWK